LAFSRLNSLLDCPWSTPAGTRRGSQCNSNAAPCHRLTRADRLLHPPQRFSPERSARRPRFAYLPFGGGPRICIGAQLALTEVSLLIATMAQRYRLKLVPGQDIVLVHRVTQRPRDGIRMRLERRNEAHRSGNKIR
jgi:cytochrome P450